MNFSKIFQSYLTTPLMGLCLLSALSSEIFTGFLQVYTKSSAYDDSQRLLHAFIGFVVVLSFSGLMNLVIHYSLGRSEGLIEDDSFKNFSFRVLGDWVTLNLIAQFRVLIGCLFFLVPGLVEAARLCILNNIIFFSPEMKSEDFNPIPASRGFLNFQRFGLILSSLLVLGLPLVPFLTLNTVSFFGETASLPMALLKTFILGMLHFISVCYFLAVYYQYRSHTTSQEQ